MICLRIGKTNTAKTPLGDFKITTLENPLLSKQVVTSKGIPVPYTNLQLHSYPNTQLDLFCSDNLSFWCMTPSTWLTNCADPSIWLQSPTREGCWLQSSSVHSDDEDQEDAWSENPTVHKHSSTQERWTRANSVSGHNLLEQTCSTLVQLVSPLTALKIIILYV